MKIALWVLVTTLHMSLCAQQNGTVTVTPRNRTSTAEPGPSWFTHSAKQHIPQAWTKTFAAKSGDMDGDGKIDLVVITSPGGLSILHNEGQGILSKTKNLYMPSGLLLTGLDLALADFDGDGDLDIVTASHQVHINDGAGNFTSGFLNLPTNLPGKPLRMVSGDVDGDGDIDLLIGCGNDHAGSYQDRLYLNNGNATFTVATANLPVDSDETVDLKLFDADGDGDLDAVLTGSGPYSGAPTRLYINNGSGVFTKTPAINFPSPKEPTNAVATGDVDGDGDIDLITFPRRHSSSNTTWVNRLWLNDGKGKFSTLHGLPFITDNEEVNDADLRDIDNDGDLDLTYVSGGYYNEKGHVMINDGLGVFTDASSTWWPLQPNTSSRVCIADFDGDRFLDAYVGNGFDKYRHSRMLMNDAGRRFVDLTQIGGIVPQSSWNAYGVYGDVDRDGDLDFISGRERDSYRYTPILYHNDGTGKFIRDRSAALPSVPVYYETLAIADLDGDGDLDIAIPSTDGQLTLLANTGKGKYVIAPPSRVPVKKTRTYSIVAGDLDGDGDTDLILGNYDRGGYFAYGVNLIYLNLGSGFFIESTNKLPTANQSTKKLELIDLDGDGDLDLVEIFEKSPQLVCYRNDGRARFSYLYSLANCLHAEFGDIDSDGDLDLVAQTSSQGVSIYENRGLGSYTDITASIGSPRIFARSSYFDLGDLDGDGDIDILIDSSGFPLSRNASILLQDKGKLSFSKRIGFGPYPSTFKGLHLIDVDDDGDADLRTDSSVVGTHMHVNRHLQLRSVYAPRPGWRYRLDLQSVKHIGAGWFFFGPTLLSSPLTIPQGKLKVDLSTAVTVPFMASRHPTYSHTLEFTLPTSASLVGITLFAQGATGATTATPERLTNLVFDKIW